jgi:DNA-binding IclR family transcriptional regulator
VALSAQILSKMELPQRARPYLLELVQRTQQSAHLAVLPKESPLWAVYIGHERSPSRVQVDIRVGHMAPTHCTAVGKALLAYLPRDQLALLAPDGKLQRLTARTPGSLEALEHQLRTIRERGYAVDDEEFHRNIRCVAAPVRTGDGSVVASMGISGIATDISREAMPRIASIVVQASAQLSQEMGYVGRAPARSGELRRLTGSRA